MPLSSYKPLFTGLVMNTQSIFPSFLLSPSFKGYDFSGHQHTQNQEIDNHQNKARNQLADDFYQPAHSVQALAQDELAIVNSKMAMQSMQTSTSQSTEIKVMTNDGDLVTISINQSSASSRSAIKIQQNDFEMTEHRESYSFESGLNISIEGNLDEDEQKSISTLLNKMDKVSQDFFLGNVESAFEHAQKLGFDNEQLAGFSMDLNRQRSVQAVAAYQQTAKPEENINPQKLKQASDFLADTESFLDDPKTGLDSLLAPEQTFVDLFSAIAQMYARPEENKGDNPTDAMFLKMIEKISNDLLGAKEIA